MHCASRGLLVDETVEDLDDVFRCPIDVRRGRARVEYDPTQVTLDDITVAIADLGYRSTRA
jgi:copper chaperone CopZ